MKYVGLYNDPQDIAVKKNVDAVASRVSTNEDNIALAESDIEALQGDVTTLQTNVGNIQNALGSKQNTVTGGASTIVDDNLTANRALVSNANGKVAVSDVTSTELGYLDGVTSAIQGQIDGKVSKAGDTMTGDLTVGSAQIQTNGHVTGTWLKGTAANHLTTAATKIAVQDASGWIYHRTPSEILSDIGALPDTTVIPTVPDNLVTYAAGTTVEAVDGVDADTLQGHAASYFATQSGLTAANTNITTNANNITELSTKVSGVEGSISSIQTSVNNMQTSKLDKSGGTMTGALVAQNNTDYTTKQVRNIIISTADPSGGSNGDIWVKYTV